MRTRTLITGFFLIAWLGVFQLGCRSQPLENGLLTRPLRSGDVPTYGEIAQKQNRRAENAPRYWAPTDVQLDWTDEDGKRHVESGDGLLIFVQPDRVAMTFSKVGEIGFWAGCNEEMFWVFEGGDDPVAYVARNENAFHPDCDSLPIAIHPLELIDLLGLFSFPMIEDGDAGGHAAADAANGMVAGDPRISDDRKYIVVDVPGRWSLRRVYLDPTYLLPRRVEIVSRDDPSIVHAWSELDGYVDLRVMSVEGAPAPPKVPTKMKLHQSGMDGVVSISAYKPRDRSSRGPIPPKVFEYRAVARSMTPNRRVVLDARCPNPAFAASNDE